MNTTEMIVDYISVINLLELCASGLSISSISRRLNASEEFIKEEIIKFLGFGGFEQDLFFDPLFVFMRSTSLEDFKKELDLFNIPVDTDVNLCYNMCIKVTQIRKELDEYYDKTK